MRVGKLEVGLNVILKAGDIRKHVSRTSEEMQQTRLERTIVLNGERELVHETLVKQKTNNFSYSSMKRLLVNKLEQTKHGTNH